MVTLFMVPGLKLLGSLVITCSTKVLSGSVSSLSRTVGIVSHAVVFPAVMSILNSDSDVKSVPLTVDIKNK